MIIICDEHNHVTKDRKEILGVAWVSLQGPDWTIVSGKAGEKIANDID